MLCALINEVGLVNVTGSLDLWRWCVEYRLAGQGAAMDFDVCDVGFGDAYLLE